MIPIELCEWAQWVCWKYGMKDGKQTKLPIIADSGKIASSTDPTTWTTIENAQAKLNGHAGIGFVFSPEDPFCGIDFDGCFRPDSNEIAPWAQTWIEKLNSYSEVSPSKTGIKVWVKGKWPLPNGKKIKINQSNFVEDKEPGIEVYDHGRYFTVTGMSLDGYPSDIQDRQDILDAICRTYFSNRAEEKHSSDERSSSLSVTERAQKYVDTIPGAISGSGGHNRTYHVACVLVLGFGLSKSEALEILREYNQRCEPEWSEKELQHKVDSADQQHGERGYLRDARESEWKNTPLPNYQEPQRARNEPDLLRYFCNDHGNAERLIAVYGDVLRYCHPMKKCLVWDGKCWTVDASKQAYKLAKSAMLEYLRQAVKAGNETHEKFGRQSLDSKRINSLLESVQCEIPVKISELDSNPYLLNFPNGTVDLRSGELFSHRRQDLITKCIQYDYVPDARCPQFLAFLWRIMGLEIDEERAGRLIHFLQTALGYSLVGITIEKIVFICWGMGDNGKSTLLELFRVLFGDYAATINVDSLMAKQIGNNELADLADLRGARFVRSSETEQGQRLNESRLKRITQGMGVIRTCRKYENMIEFPETHTLWIDANHKPTVRGQDNAIWNRLALIPFEITIPKSEQDQNLGTKLLNEAEGILAWAVAGAVKWHQEGLQRPPEVNQAVATWRAESDPLNDFIEEHCEVKPDLWSPSGTLWREYEQWTEASGVDALSRTAFNTRLRNMGCKANRRKIGNKTTRIFEGITLLG